MPAYRNTQDAKDARAESLLARLMRGRREVNSRIFQLPAVGIPARIYVLSQTEVVQCRSQAYHFLNDGMGLDPNALVNRDAYADEVTLQILARALRDPDDIGKPLAESVADLRDNTTSDERAAIFDLYVELQREVDPARAEMTEADALEILEHVKKKDSTRLVDIGSSRLASFLLFMASRQWTLPTARSGPSQS
jgi:hypothetical protein